MKVLSVVGARPQFVKEAALQSELNRCGDIQEILVHTGQHYDVNMSDVFFDVLGIREPDYNLGVSSGLHGEMTGTMIIELEKIIMKEMPDKVILYGDTNSTVAGALAASKLKIEIAHVEAGLRQKKPKNMPEEINRVLTDHVSSYLFCPSMKAIENLKNEGITEGVSFTGDVMYDIFLKMKSKFEYQKIEELKLRENDYIIMTLHRDFNVDNRETLDRILTEVNRISGEIPVIYPIHPRTRKRITEYGLFEAAKNIIFIEPLDYLQLMGLTERCFKAVTDSGGFQKEAYFAGKQAVVLMPETAWAELVEAGMNQLTEPSGLYDAVMRNTKQEFVKEIYGSGNASELIVQLLR